MHLPLRAPDIGRGTKFQKFSEEARTSYRQSARTLVQGLINYLSTSDDQDATSEAHSIGYEYASRARRFGLTSVEAAKALLFFRDVLLESVIQAYEQANVPSGQAWGEILRKVNAFTDSILQRVVMPIPSIIRKAVRTIFSPRN